MIGQESSTRQERPETAALRPAKQGVLSITLSLLICGMVGGVQSEQRACSSSRDLVQFRDCFTAAPPALAKDADLTIVRRFDRYFMRRMVGVISNLGGHSLVYSHFD
jgi:hypothetical protein